MNTLQVQPYGFTMSALEKLPLAFDTAPLLDTGQTPTSPLSVLWDLTIDAAVTLADNPTVSENLIIQIIRGGALTNDHIYRLTVTFHAGTSAIWAMEQQITCVE